MKQSAGAEKGQKNKSKNNKSLTRFALKSTKEGSEG